MEIINRRQRMSSVARKIRREQDRTIGLVPTMGALHQGHLSLVREARQMCDLVVVSVFVNPAQFGPSEDYERYPRDLTKDTALLTDYNVDYIFAPPVEEIYPRGYSVVTVLLNIIRPDFAFFGQKDAQQALIIKRLVRDLAFDTEILVLSTVREDSGLAISSRNAYLTEQEREAAQVIRRALVKGREAHKDGERSAGKLADIVRSTIEAEPRARIDYVSVTDAETLEKLDKLDERAILIAVAARIGKTRLIDNIVVNIGAKRKDAAKAKA